MKSATLEQLYRMTVDLFSTPDSAAFFDIGAGLDWVDRVLPDFTSACRDAVVNGTETIFGLWEEWLRDDAGAGTVAGIREAGEIESYEWRKQWLRTLILTTRRLNAGRAYETDKARYAIGEKAAAECGRLFSTMPPAFWHDLVDTLSSPPSKTSKTGPTIAVSFPLVLAERMIVAGDSIDVLLADMVLESRPYSGAAAYLAPEQMATRCLDGEFLSIFAQAMNQVARFIAPEKLSSIRVKLKPRRPEEEVFFQKLVIRGPSGGGALAAGIYALSCGHKTIDRSLAVSFALSSLGFTSSEPRTRYFAKPLAAGR